MAEFIGDDEKYISAREPIVFENKTESKFEVCAGIVFHKSGIYEVSVVGNRTIVSEVPERKKGKWIMKYKGSAVTSYKCSECGRTVKDDTGYDVSKDYPFCHCGADMREEQDESKAEVNGCIPGDCGESS